MWLPKRCLFELNALVESFNECVICGNDLNSTGTIVIGHVTYFHLIDSFGIIIISI